MNASDLNSKTATAAIKEHRHAMLQYHNTIVAKIDFRTGKLTLNTNGWFTATTKKRMNQFMEWINLPYYVQQKGFEWYVKEYDSNDIVAEFNGSNKVTFKTSKTL